MFSVSQNKDDAVIDKAWGIADARIEIDHFHWYVPHYTPTLSQENILMNQILKKNTNRTQIY